MSKVDPINAAREEIRRSQEKLLSAYFSTIGDAFRNVNTGTQKAIFDGLDALIALHIDRTHERHDLAILNEFDGVKARKIREDAGLSQKDLADQLGFCYEQSASKISDYERGKTRPSYPPKGEWSKKYLAWLKEQGYNPFETKKQG